MRAVANITVICKLFLLLPALLCKHIVRGVSGPYVANKLMNKKHLKNVGPIHYCEPPHAHSPGVASGTVARRLRIHVHDANDDNDNDNA